MTKFFNKLKKTLFLAHFQSIFPILTTTKCFFLKIRKGRRKDGQILFCRTLPANARGPKKTYNLTILP